MKKQELPEVSISEHAGRRYLHLGTEWVQGSMWIDKPFEIELDYVQRMMAWLMFAEPAEVKAMHSLQLGLGSGALTKYCFKKLRMRSTVVEINPMVVEVCKQWFKLPPEDERLRIIIDDASHALQKKELLAQADNAMVDLYDHEAAAPVLDSEDFYDQVRNTLTEHGAMTVNLFGRSSSYEKSLKKIQRVFGNVPGAVWAFKPTKEGNTIVLALRTPQQPDPQAFLQRAQVVEARFGLPALKWLRVLRPVG
jgi:spermidine synthase